MTRPREPEYAMTFDEIGSTVGLTGPAVVRIYERALAKLRSRKPGGLLPALQDEWESSPPKTAPAPSLAREHSTPVSDDDPLSREYRDWDDTTSRVVSGPLGEHRFPGTRFPDRSAARVHWRGRATIIEEYPIPGRWIFRIKRQHATTT